MKLKKYKEPKAEKAKFNISAHSGLMAIFAINTIPHFIRILLNNYACTLEKGSYNKVIGFRLKGFDSEMMYYILTIEISTQPKNILITEVMRTTKKDFKSKLNKGFFEPIQPLKKDRKPKVIADVETWEEKQEREKMEAGCKPKKCLTPIQHEEILINQNRTEIIDLLQKAKNYIYFNAIAPDNTEIIRELTEGMNRIKGYKK